MDVATRQRTEIARPHKRKSCRIWRCSHQPSLARIVCQGVSPASGTGWRHSSRNNKVGGRRMSSGLSQRHRMLPDRIEAESTKEDKPRAQPSHMKGVSLH